MTELKLKIEKAVKNAHTESVLIDNIFSTGTVARKNKFLFFIKPEITQDNPQIELGKVLDIIFDKLNEFQFVVQDAKLLGAKYLEEYNIIAQHYGVINQMSKNALQNMGEEAKSRFAEIFNVSVEQVDVLGSLQLMEKYPSLTPEILFAKWQEAQQHKIAGGTYSAKVEVEGKFIYVVNGFHPMQLENFIKQGRSIVVFTVASDIDWSIARNDFIGATNPLNANTGSIRKVLLEKKDELGLPEVDGSKNGVHLSAGPVEALVELMRFSSDLTAGERLNHTDFAFGRLLEENFSKEEIKSILSNQNVTYNNELISVFDLTEEKNSKESIEILKEAQF